MLESRRLRPPEPPPGLRPGPTGGLKAAPDPLPIWNTLYFCLATPLPSNASLSCLPCILGQITLFDLNQAHTFLFRILSLMT